MIEDAHCAFHAAPLEQFDLCRVVGKFKSAAVHTAGQTDLYGNCFACTAADRSDRKHAARSLREWCAECNQQHQGEKQWEKSFFHSAAPVS